MNALFDENLVQLQRLGNWGGELSYNRSSDLEACADESIREQLDAHKDAALVKVTRSIKTAFNTRGDLSATAVPNFSASANRTILIPIADAVSYLVSAPGKSLDALIAVLAGSDCPLVQAWRDAMASEYIGAHGDEIAEVSL